MRHKPPIIQLAIILILVLATSFSSARALTQVLPQNHSLEEMKNNSVPIEKIVQPRAIFENTDLSCYRTVDEIYALAEDWEAEKPGFVEWVDIGDSWEKTQGSDTGYDIKVLVLTNEAITEEKPVLFLMSGLHARELAPVELNLRFAEYLLENYEKDADVTWLLDYREIHFLFVANPDGHEIVMNTGDSWKKNTNNYYCPGTDMRGADLFRNFPFQWESFSDTCSDIYPGLETPKEPETTAIIQHLFDIFPDQREGDEPVPLDIQNLFIDIHSYGEVIYWPYSYTSIPAPNHDQLKNLAYRLANLNHYLPLRVIDTPQDSIAGTPFDYVYGELGVTAYTIEVGSDMDGGYFTVCSAIEESIIEKNIEALIYSAKVADAPYQTPFGPNIVNLRVTSVLNDNVPSLMITSSVSDLLEFDYSIYTQPIKSVRYSIDVPLWKAEEEDLRLILFPVDGAYDEKDEFIEEIIFAEPFSTESHILYMQGQDTTGQWGPVSAVYFAYEEPPPLEDDKLIFLPLIFK